MVVLADHSRSRTWPFKSGRVDSVVQGLILANLERWVLIIANVLASKLQIPLASSV